MCSFAHEMVILRSDALDHNTWYSGFVVGWRAKMRESSDGATRRKSSDDVYKFAEPMRGNCRSGE